MGRGRGGTGESQVGEWGVRQNAGRRGRGASEVRLEKSKGPGVQGSVLPCARCPDPPTPFSPLPSALSRRAPLFPRLSVHPFTSESSPLPHHAPEPRAHRRQTPPHLNGGPLRAAAPTSTTSARRPRPAARPATRRCAGWSLATSGARGGRTEPGSRWVFDLLSTRVEGRPRGTGGAGAGAERDPGAGGAGRR